MNTLNIIGIDIGSVALSLVLTDEKGSVINSSYQFHHGAISETLRLILGEIDINGIGGIATTISGPEILRNISRYDSQIAIIAAVRQYHREVGSILFVGGENFGLITFNEEGDYERYRSNSSCAAGTGSFLDQQAKRLNLKSIDTLSTIAFCNMESVPKIATRCAVFAKTDLIHAQQEGYSIGQISDGLCEGLAKNVIDALLPDQDIRTPLILAGGVSMNQAVVKHFCNMLQTEPVIGQYSHLYGAIGAALLYLEEMPPPQKLKIKNWQELFIDEKKDKIYGYPPLQLSLSNYPDFNSNESYIYTPKCNCSGVEIDIYNPLRKEQEVYLGIDIGSTSTKAAIINESNDVLVGLYTLTSGQPISAVQAVFEAIENISLHHNCIFSFSGVGTTGSGRKFIGRIINADLMIDEITAHARAAYELNKEVDTIIEIGGQDAKFTIMTNGMVTSSVMNNVCAAGTGSFIEEQALKLGVPLTAYADRAVNTPAPVASNRCTVFMERDINNLLTEGYTIDEVLASVLHSVCENYLAKVAVEANIGTHICFQGATARNKALIAAFEHRLKKPIFVSKFCHLTGALGSALILTENKIRNSSFRGISLYKEKIPVRNEICSLCNNNCKINKVNVQGDTVAFGFLCGRDYDSKQYIGPTKKQYDLIKARNNAFRPAKKSVPAKSNLKIGIPHALYLAEEMPLWKHFFNTLGIETITTDNFRNAIKSGKKIAGAEFCAPMNAFFGHVQYLVDKCDYIFLPVYLEAKEPKENAFRYYCYYTQFAVMLATGIKKLNLKNKTISPVIDHHSFPSKIELFTMLKPVLSASYWEIFNAYESALTYFTERQDNLRNIYEREMRGSKDICVALLGRPYTILQSSMNNSIPDIFSNIGIKTFYQDMLPSHRQDMAEIDPLLQRLHWNYAAKILKAALFSARAEGIYPVYVTSFKCSPDSFAIEYFKRIMDKYGKPYLILELDEHDSKVGYETRIEAAVRSFRNHYKSRHSRTLPAQSLSINSESVTKIKGKTLLFPCFDPINSKLLEAVFIREGIDARMVPLTEKTIRYGLRTNKGQCIPVNLISQSYIDYIKENYLDPAQTAVWCFESHIACNIRMYPQMIKGLLEANGSGMEKVDVYIGNVSMSDISMQASIEAYFAHMFGGMLRKIGCKIRPYEKEKGLTDKVISQALNIFYNTLLGGRNKDDDVEKVISLFRKIETIPHRRPQVAIFGDLYARDNDIFNQNLIHCIEEYGGEVITTPFNEFVKLVIDPYIRRWFHEGEFLDILVAKTVITLVNQLEKNYYKLFNELLHEPHHDTAVDYKEIYDVFNVKLQNCGESTDNLIKIAALIKYFPDISLFIQTNPAFCCAGLITEAMVPRIEEYTGIPIVTLNYDGTGKNINQKIRPYIKYPRKNRRYKSQINISNTIS
ncbi:MAG: R-phenyllactate dehydratase activator [Smithella sp. PtaU1.Bin162]|nr:MAG: R-phenyllactate dehydratase activator [Smithella sp. PtaU1.Bin162]